MHRTIIALAFIFCAATSFAGDPASAGLNISFSIQPQRTLPGLPISLAFEFANPTAKPIPVPNEIMLVVVRDDSGESYVLPGGSAGFSTRREWSSEAVPAHSKLALQLPSEGMMLKLPWFPSRKLSRPGTYELQARFVTSRLPIEPTTEVALRSSLPTNSAILIVEEPASVDAEVWREMLAFGGGHWPGAVGTPETVAFSKSIVEKYPKSSYAGWFASMTTSRSLDECAATLRSWLSTATQDGYTEWRQLTLAKWDIILTYQYIHRDLKSSQEHEKAARESLNRLLRNSKDDALRKQAQERLDYLNEPDEPDAP